MRSRLLITVATGCFFNIVSLNGAAELSPPADVQSLTPQGSLTQSVSAPCVRKVYERRFNDFLNHLVSEIPKDPTLLFFIDPNDKKISLWKPASNLEELVKVAEEYRAFLEQKNAPDSIQDQWKRLNKSIKKVQEEVDDSDSDAEDVDVPAFLGWWSECTQNFNEKFNSLHKELQTKFQELLSDLMEKCNRKLQDLREQQAHEPLKRIRESSREVYDQFYIRNNPFKVSDLMYNESVMALLEQLQIDPPYREHQNDLSSIDSLVSVDDSSMLHLLLMINAPAATVDTSKFKKIFSLGSSKIKMKTRRAHEYLKRSLDYWKKLKEAAEGDDIRFLTIRFLLDVRKEGLSEDDDVEYSQHFRKSVRKSIEACLDLNTTRQQLLEEMQATIKVNHTKYLNQIQKTLALKDKFEKNFKKKIKLCKSIWKLQGVFAQGHSKQLTTLFTEMGLQSLQEDLQNLTKTGIKEALKKIEPSPSKSKEKQKKPSKRDREESIPDEEPLKMMQSGVEKEKVAHSTSTYHPHDKFVHVTFEQIPMAQDFFRKVLPGSLSDLLDLADLTNRSSILNGSDFSQSRPNSLFRVKLRDDESYIFLLIKHLTAQQHKAPKMICDYVEKVKETYEKELKELSCSYKPRVITIVLHTGDRKLAPEYLGQFNRYTGQILDFFSIRIAPPVIWVDLLDSGVVERFEDFKTTAKIIRHVRLKDSLDERREEILRKLNDLGYKKYIDSLKTYVLKNSSLAKEEKNLWKLAFKQLRPDVEETEDAYPLDSQLFDDEEILSQVREGLGSKEIRAKIMEVLTQTCQNQNRKRPREEVLPEEAEKEDSPAVQQYQPSERAGDPESEGFMMKHKYTSRDIARLLTQFRVEERQDPLDTFTLDGQENSPVENLVSRHGNTYVLPPVSNARAIVIEAVVALFNHSRSQTHLPRMILVPYNPGGHWVTLRMDIPEDGVVTITYIDSLMSEDKAINKSRIEEANAIMVNLIQALTHQIPALSNRNIVPTVITPRIQSNDIDCGVLTVTNIMDILKGIALPTDLCMTSDAIKEIREEHSRLLQEMGEDFDSE